MQTIQHSEILPNHGQSSIRVSTHRVANLDKILAILKTLVPLTLPVVDQNGNQLQLWKTEKYGLIGSVIDLSGRLNLISKNHIHSPLCPNVIGDTLMARMEKISLRRWAVVFNPSNQELILLPYMSGAARFDKNLPQRPIKVGTASPLSHLTKQELVARFEELVTAGKYEKRGLAPEHGRGTYYNKEKGIEYHIDHDTHKEHPHLDMWREKEHPKYDPKKIAKTNLMDKWRFGYKKDEDKTPAKEQFTENLEKNGLVKSFKASHPGFSVSSKGRGASSDIGGVSGSVELIKGLFESAESLFDCSHSFFIPQIEGKIPFSDQELVQILQELAIGIYVHNTVPFFSLHFNENADLYPVIHPAYENTLVGQVFSMLDYYMKGYLNGGVFQDSFVRKWQQHPVKVEANKAILEQLINFKSYAEKELQGHDRRYTSLRERIKHLEINALEQLEQQVKDHAQQILNKKHIAENPIFSDYTKFSNSFRIIAHQRSIQKAEELFVLDWDFEVLYTIVPDPDYKIALDEYFKQHGEYPPAYERLLSAYEFIKKRIHDHMVKMPLCQKYFSMLGVINFFSYYFTTLKMHRKMPLLPQVEIKRASCPALFPSLPILSTREETLKFNAANLMKELVSKHSALITSYLINLTNIQIQEQMRQVITNEVKNHLCQGISKPMQSELAERSDFIDLCNKTQTSLLGVVNAAFTEYETIAKEKLGEHLYSQKKEAIIKDLVKGLPTIVNDQEVTLLPFTASVFILPSEQSTEEIERGKRIVGGCGMKINPLTIQLSPLGEIILEHARTNIQQNSSAHWSPISLEIGGMPKGAIFSLPFDDIPLGMEENNEMETLLLSTGVKIPKGDSKDEMDTLLVFPSQSQLAEMDQMYTIVQTMRKGQKDTFIQQIEKINLQNMRDRQGRTLLHHASLSKDPFYTQELLKRRLSTKEEDNQGNRPIHFAAMSGQIKQLEILLQADSLSLDVPNKQKATPLIVAVQHGQQEATEFLLSKGAKGEVKLSNGYTVLHCAVHRGHLKIVLTLLEKSEGARKALNQGTNEGVTPLMLACQTTLALVTFLIEKGADPKLKAKNGTTALDIAVKNDSFPICQFLFPFSEITVTTIEMAIKKASLEINKLLSTRSNYLQYQNNIEDNPLIMSLRYANLPLAHHILDLLADVKVLNAKNKLKESPIEFAARGGFYDILERLLRSGATISRKDLLGLLLESGYRGQNPFIQTYTSGNFTPTELAELLLIAAKAGNHIAISNILIPLGANLDDFQSPSGWKIEHYLAQSDGIFLLRQHCLTVQDAFFLKKDPEGKTIAYIAGESGSLRVLSFLLDHLIKNSVDLNNHYHDRHLFCSVLESGNIEGVRLFVETLKNPNLMNLPLNASEHCAAHIAAQLESKQILTFLHRQGSSLTCQDKDGHDPLFYAIKARSEDAVNFLLEEEHRVPITSESIFAAASLENEQIFMSLIKAGADLDVKSTNGGNTALMLSIQHHSLPAFLRLIKHSVSLNSLNSQGWSPLLCASCEGKIEMLEMIYSRLPKDAVQLKLSGNNALHIACKNRQSDCIEFLVRNGFSIDEANGEGKKPAELANNSLGPLAALGINPQKDKYQSYLTALNEIIKTQDISPILAKVNEWPINTYFSINFLGKNLKGTLLHILLATCHNCEGLEKLVHQICGRKLFQSNLKDQDGSSYAHLMIKAELDPTKVNLLSLEEQDNDGRTPLHLAAIEDSPVCLKSLINKLGKNKTDSLDHNGSTPLFYAIRAQKRNNVKELIKNGSNVNHVNIMHITPLILACALDNYPVIRMLVKYGASIKQRNHSFLNPLIASLEAKKEDISLFLLYQGADIKTISKNGRMIAHLAAKTGKNTILRFLASKGQTLTACDENGWQPIHYATTRIKTLAYLKSIGISIETPTINTGHSPNPPKVDSFTTLQVAAMTGTAEAVRWLLDHRANPEKTVDSQLTILRCALQNTPDNSTELLLLFKDYLLSNDLQQLFPAISAAIAKDYIDPLRILYTMGVPIQAELNHGLTGLHYACLFGALHCTEFFLTHGASIKVPAKTGETPLELAAANQSPQQFQFILNYTNPPLDQRYQRGETLLHIATRSGNLAHVALLIDQGADFDAQDVQGNTPLFVAAEKGFKDIVKLFMLCGANSKVKTFFSELQPEQIAKPEIKDIISEYQNLYLQAPAGSTPLHIAAQSNNRLAVALICRHFDVNQSNEKGITALHQAALSENLIAIGELLRQQRIDVNCEDLQGRTPLGMVCLQTSNLAIAKVLLQAGADPKKTEKNGKNLIQILQNQADKSEFLKLVTS